jgi:hypothetical protein
MVGCQAGSRTFASPNLGRAMDARLPEGTAVVSSVDFEQSMLQKRHPLNESESQTLAVDDRGQPDCRGHDTGAGGRT